MISMKVVCRSLKFMMETAKGILPRVTYETFWWLAAAAW